jgi:hypothetical protein
MEGVMLTETKNHNFTKQIKNKTKNYVHKKHEIKLRDPPNTKPCK